LQPTAWPSSPSVLNTSNKTNRQDAKIRKRNQKKSVNPRLSLSLFRYLKILFSLDFLSSYLGVLGVLAVRFITGSKPK
jgi:hypothetical protein